ncbi:MAG TPA: translocation/assembly module TamB, partial [Allosphingosinicella sp.]|nr:translocation/assembly module TamB [Allosphingosinicella sp.]
MAAEAVLDPALAPARSPPRRWRVGLAKFLTVVALGLLLGFAALVAFLDTAAGHRFIVDRIAAMTPASGLRIRIGRIDGSIWGRTQLKDVRLYDPDGLFAESSEIGMDWRPLDFLFNSLVINELESDLVILHRMPDLIPSREPRPFLPEYDIRLGRLDVRQLRIGAAVTGRERVGSLSGEAEIRNGRALLGLRVAVRDGGDRLSLRLDAEPDRDRFDLDARIMAPANSVVGAMLGTRRPVRLDLGGDGTWRRWAGTALLDVSARRTADFRLSMASGRFQLRGTAAPAPFLRGKLQRLTSPRVLVSGSGFIADRRIEGRLSAISASLRIEARGIVDLAQGRYRQVALAAELTRPPAMFTNMTGRQIRFAALLDGRFGNAGFVYRLTAPRIAFDQTGFEEVRAEGRGNLSRAPVIVPVLVTARRVTGVGEVAGGILANLRVQGLLRVTPRRLTGDDLVLGSDKLSGLVDLEVDLRTGVYAVAVNAGMRTYAIPGFGLVDVLSELRAVPGPGGRGTMVTGTARAWVRRLDNRFLFWVAGGLPTLTTSLTRGPDRILRFSNLRIAAPKLALAGSGLRRIDGTFQFEGAGRHGDYGPLRLTLDGRIERPRLAIRLERPADSLGLRNVLLNLEPGAAGYAWRAEGGSTLGPFTGHGGILLPPGRPAIIQVAALNVSGTRASGALRSDPGGFTGQLDVAGGGLDGRLLFGPFAGHQRIMVNLTANDARFVGPPPIVIRRGTIEGMILLDPAGTSVEGRLTARGLSRGPLSIANVDAQASLRGGIGQIRARIAGSRGRDFTFNAVVDVAPNRYRVSGSGTLDRRPLELVTPAELTNTPDGWRLG